MNAKALPSNKTLSFVGVVLVLLGLILLISPAAVGAAVVKLVALVLVVTGVAQLIQGLQAGRAHSVVSSVLGLAVAGLGVLVWLNPALGSGFLTALLMIFFAVHGLYKLSTSIRYRHFSGWSWMLVSGLLSLVFVYLLWKQWPLSGAWAIGVLVGLDLLLTGIAMIILSRALKRARSTGYFDTIQL